MTLQNADDMLFLLSQFIRQVVEKEDYLLVANSYVAYLALGLALEDNKLKNSKLEGMFLFGPCTVADYKKRKLPKVQVDDRFIESNLEASFYGQNYFDSFLENAIVATTETWQRYKTEIAPAYARANKEFTQIYRENGYALSVESKFGTLQFSHPVTVLVGKLDDSVGYEDAWNTLKHLPQLTYCCLSGVGHLMQLENPQVFHLLVTDWLKKCDSD